MKRAIPLLNGLSVAVCAAAIVGICIATGGIAVVPLVGHALVIAGVGSQIGASIFAGIAAGGFIRISHTYAPKPLKCVIHTLSLPIRIVAFIFACCVPNH